MLGRLGAIKEDADWRRIEAILDRGMGRMEGILDREKESRGGWRDN